MADVSIDNLTKALRDALYVGVGAGVLTQFESVAGRVEDRVKVVEDRIEAAEERIETLLDQVEDTLPTQTRDAFKQARKVAKDTRTQVRSQVRTLRTHAA